MKRSFAVPNRCPEAGVARSDKAAVLKDGKAAHFSLGSHGEPLVSTKELYYANPGQNARPAALDPAEVKDLRTEHFALGDQPNTWISQYKHSHNWLQPVPTH